MEYINFDVYCQFSVKLYRTLNTKHALVYSKVRLEPNFVHWRMQFKNMLHQLDLNRFEQNWVYGVNQ